MIIDKVDDKPIPRYLIYDIIKFEVNDNPAHFMTLFLKFLFDILR